MALCAHVHVVYKVSAERCSPRGKGRSEEGVGGEWGRKGQKGREEVRRGGGGGGRRREEGEERVGEREERGERGEKEEERRKREREKRKGEGGERREEKEGGSEAGKRCSLRGREREEKVEFVDCSHLEGFLFTPLE